MVKDSSFQIENISTTELLIIHEPEGFEFQLPPNESVTVECDPVPDGVVLRYGIDQGMAVIGIMPERSYYRVVYKGQDVFAEFLS